MIHAKHTVRWADQQTVPVLVGQSNVRSRELFRVTAPHPCTWRIIVGAQSVEVGNAGLALKLAMQIGIGSFITQAFFDIGFNSTFLFELPGQTLSGFIICTDTVLVNGTMIFGAGLAPNSYPWFADPQAGG